MPVRRKHQAEVDLGQVHAIAIVSPFQPIDILGRG